MHPHVWQDYRRKIVLRYNTEFILVFILFVAVAFSKLPVDGSCLVLESDKWENVLGWWDKP